MPWKSRPNSLTLPPNGRRRWPPRVSPCRRGGGEDLYRWLLPWFNPRPACVDGDIEQLFKVAPYPGDEALPFGADFAESLMLACPRSDNASATWWFDGLPHTVVTVQGLRRAPDIGHMTAERQAGDHVFSLFDRLPEHTVMALTITVKPQDQVRNHVGLVRRAAVGDSAEAALTREDASRRGARDGLRQQALPDAAGVLCPR